MTTPVPDISKAVEKKPKVVEEPPYRVIVHNDDITPMNYVIYVLQYIFMLAGPRAAQVMFTAHIQGSAYVDSLPKTEALRRIHNAQVAARLAGYPLAFSLERE